MPLDCLFLKYIYVYIVLNSNILQLHFLPFWNHFFFYFLIAGAVISLQYNIGSKKYTSVVRKWKVMLKLAKRTHCMAQSLTVTPSGMPWTTLRLFRSTFTLEGSDLLSTLHTRWPQTTGYQVAPKGHELELVFPCCFSSSEPEIMLGFCYVLVTSAAQGQGYVLYILKRGVRWNMDVLKRQGQLRRA